MLDNPVKTKLAQGEVVFGTFVMEFDSPGLARIVAGTGADFIFLDMEHSGWGTDTIKRQVAAARGAGLVAIVNPRAGADAEHGRLLDHGAMGLMVPHVETGEQAARVVAGTRYPPAGRRGAAFGVAHDDYRVGDVPRTMAEADAQTLVVVKIESALGVENADQILAVPGVDVALVGHTDLSLSLGIPLDLDHPDFTAALDQVLAACRRHDKCAGCLVTDPDQGRAWIEKGFRMVAYSGDIWLFAGALKAGIDRMRDAGA